MGKRGDIRFAKRKNIALDATITQDWDELFDANERKGSFRACVRTIYCFMQVLDKAKIVDTDSAQT